MDILYDDITSKLCNLPKYKICQKDFVNGTFMIKKPGYYKLTENIKFNPKNDKPSYEFIKENPQFFLGWFCAISICCNNVILDLNRFTISQDVKFYVKQRFFMIIELANSAFIPSQGPVKNGLSKNSIVSARNCVIQNGIIGLSSHCGIHGNNNKNIIIENVKIIDFEFSGICLNNGDNVIINRCCIKDSFNKVFLNGNLSIAFNQLNLLDLILKKYNYFLSKNEILDISNYFSRLSTMINNSQLAYVNNDFSNISELFLNKSGLPDGSIVNGIQITSKGASIHNFLSVCCPDIDCLEKLSYNLYIYNTEICNLKLKTKEIVHLSTLDDKKITGTYGHIIDIENINILTQIDVIISELICKYSELGNLIKVTTNIPLNLQKMIKNNNIDCNYINNNYKFYYGFDIMAHVNKGVIGMRLDGTKKINIKNVHIHDLVNKSSKSKFNKKKYNKQNLAKHHIKKLENKDITAEIFGIVISNKCNTNISNTCIEKLKSKYGNSHKIIYFIN